MSSISSDQKKSLLLTTVIYAVLIALLFLIRFWPPYNPENNVALASGGGGGGAYRIGSGTSAGGNGANGQVKLTWGPQEINVQGNNTTISNGDITPSSTDGTDFGSVDASLGTITKTFTIQNIGSSNLILSIISIISTEFSITAEPTYPSIINGASSTTFSITFNPTSSGIKTATISIGNNDIDELIRYIENTPAISQYEPGRRRAKYLRNHR